MPANGSSSRLATLQGRKAAKARWGHRDTDDIAREYAAERLEAYIRRTVESAPPLTPEQCDRLSRALRSTGGGADVA